MPDPPFLSAGGLFLGIDSAAAPAGAVSSFLHRRQFLQGCERLLIVDDDQGTLDLRLLVLIMAMAMKHNRVLVGVCHEPHALRMPCLYEPWSSCSPPSNWARAPSFDGKLPNGTMVMVGQERVVQLSLSKFSRSTYFWGQSIRQARYGEWRELVPFLFTPRPWLRRVARCAARQCTGAPGAFTAFLSVKKLEPARSMKLLIEEILDSFLPQQALVVQSTNTSLLRLAVDWAASRHQPILTCDVGNAVNLIQGEPPDGPVKRAVHMIMRSAAQVDVSDDIGCRGTDDCARLVADLMPRGGQLTGRGKEKAMVVMAVPCARHGRACTPWRNDSWDPWSWHHVKEPECRRAVANRENVLRHIDAMITQANRKAELSARSAEGFPHIFHHVWFTWKSPTMPAHYAAYRASCTRLHQNFTLKLWADDENRAFLQRFYPWFVPFYDAYDQPVKMSDSVRYFLLHHYGGIYADLDVVCLKPLDELLALHRDSGSALLGRLGDSLGDQRYAQNVPNALMISKRKSLFMLHCIRELVVRFSCTRFFEPMRDTGAEILHKVLWGGGPDTNSQARVLDAKHFYPIDWRKTSWRNVSRRDRQLVHDEWLKPSSLLQAGLITEDSYTATFWTHGWKSWER
jgi:hypothetical protein